MPSPFPGMDPYLEGSLWTTVHSQLAPEIARQLAPKISPKYLAMTMEAFYCDAPDSVAVTARRVLYPDVGVADRGDSSGANTGIAVAPAPLQLETVMPTPVPHVNVEIRDRATRELVTAIELLSPTNKRGDGRVEYLLKRGRLLRSNAHLLEIDLIRSGQRVPMLRPLPNAPYFVFIGRAENRPFMDVWPIRLEDRLPTVPVPLLEGDPDVPLDLQLALTNIYDLCRYDLAVDYSRPAEVALTPELAAWADERLRAAGFTLPGTN